MKVLVTGGCGYIGSHTLVELIASGFSPVVLDNLSNSSVDVLTHVAQIAGVQCPFYEADIRDDHALACVFQDHPDIKAVIHFAGLKAVGESVEKPLLYYDTNVSGTVTLLKAMQYYGCKRLIFSSSATVYGDPQQLPVVEDAPLNPVNPYGHTKVMIETMLNDYSKTDPQFQSVILRYFNPVGAHKSGLIGENPKGTPNNLFPYILQVASGNRPYLEVFGNDYDTPDGTGVRDYIHVVDLAKGHVAALKNMMKLGCHVFNLGTGRGYSVMEMVKTFESVTGRKVPYQIVGRRKGDIATCYADASRAAKELGWKATLSIEDMCEDGWRYAFRHNVC